MQMTSSGTRAQPRRAARKPDVSGSGAPSRIVVQYPAPAVDGGRYPAKRCVGDTVVVSADVFRDGHDLLRVVVRHLAPGEQKWQETEMHRVDAHLDGVRWEGSFEVLTTGRHEYTIEAWTDVFGTWRDELERKLSAAPRPEGVTHEDLAGELSEGILLLKAAAENAAAAGDRRLIEHALKSLEDAGLPEAAKHDIALGPELFEAVERSQERHGRVTLATAVAVEVDPVRARFGSWYELFPRSWGGLEGVARRVPELAELGFDIVYLPPDPSDRSHQPQGRQQRAGGRAG